MPMSTERGWENRTQKSKVRDAGGHWENVNRFSVGNFEGFHLKTDTSYKRIQYQECCFVYFEINLVRLHSMESQQLFQFHRSLFLMHIHTPGIISSNTHDVFL